MNTHNRCAICNKVSARDIETDLGDFSENAFIPDPDNDKFTICLECNEVVEEQRMYYYIKDNWWGDEEVLEDEFSEVEGFVSFEDDPFMEEDEDV